MDGLMQGKRVVVSGATAGIGYATARGLAALGAQVIILGRDPAKCAQVVAQVSQQTGNQSVSYLAVDLSSQRAIHQAADTLTQRYPSLDVLVNNAGGVFLQRQESVEGIEMTFALNHLSYFVLTNRRLPLLQASSGARIVSVSSSGHQNATLAFDDIEGKQQYRGIFAYDQSKLANVVWTYALARRLAGTTLTANCLHPGLVATNFGANNGPVLRRIVRPLLNIIAASPARGADTSIYLASSPAVATTTGAYFGNKRATRSSPASYNVQDGERLWQLSEAYAANVQR